MVVNTLLRRGASKALIAVVIIIIIVAAAVGAYYLTQPKAPQTTTPATSTTSPLTSTSTTPTSTAVTTSTPPATSTTTTVTTTAPAVKKVFHKSLLIIVNKDAMTRVNLLRSGTVDAAAIPPENVADVLGYTQGNYKIIKEREILTPRITWIELNTQKPPFNNPLVRRALTLAVPYELILSTAYANYAKPLYGVIPKGMMGYTEYNIINYTAIPYEKRMEMAKELIKKSGIDPSKYSFEIWYPSGLTEREKTAVLISQSWSKLGFKISIRGLAWSVFLSKTETMETDAALDGWGPDYMDPDDYVYPIFYGGTKFKEVHVYVVNKPEDVGKYVMNATVIDTPKYYVVVGMKGTGAKVSVTGKPYLVVSYVPDWKNTLPIKKSSAWINIDPAWYRNVTVDALIIAGRNILNPEIREPIYQAVFILSNKLNVIIWLTQGLLVRPYWSWVQDRYFNPTLNENFERADLVWEVPNAPTVSTGIKDYSNDPSTYVVAVGLWPQTLDPHFNYELLGWSVFNNIGDTLVTYWRDNLKELAPDLAVAWAHNEKGTEWYFVIRGNVKAYDPWHNKVYDISAIDALWSIWRVARLQGEPSWLIADFIDVNASKVLSEEEFDKVLSEHQLVTEYHGKEVKVSSLKNLLSVFGYKGPTAGVVMLKLYKPYPPILSILADPCTYVIPLKYPFDYVDELKGKYEQMLEECENGKNPAAWAKYFGVGESDPVHKFIHKYPIGSGSYYIKEYVEGSYLYLHYNPYYWNTTLWEQLYGFKP